MHTAEAMKRRRWVDDDEIQLMAHGPDGDGAVSSVGADAQGLVFEPEYEVPAPPPQNDEEEPE